MKIEYHNLYTHFIFTTLNRQPLITEESRERIEKYITGIVKNNKSKLYAIDANPEHIHFLVSRSPEISEEKLARIIAESTEKFINHNKLCPFKFEFQKTAAAFSVSRSDVEKVIKYILDQPIHHKKTSFAEEYRYFMNTYQKPIRGIE